VIGESFAAERFELNGWLGPGADVSGAEVFFDLADFFGLLYDDE